MKCFLLLAMAGTSAWSGDILLPVGPLERAGSAAIVYRTIRLATEAGDLAVRWTDAHGRVVEDNKIPVELVDEKEIGFRLDLHPSFAVANPSGQTVGYYSGNLLVPQGHAGKNVPIAVNDRPGRWAIRSKDVHRPIQDEWL